MNETIEKSVFEEIPTEKIYSQNTILRGTFFAGPLVAGYCIAENFKTFNDYEKARNTWIITILFTIGIIALVFVLPENFPNIIFPLIYSGLSAYFIKTFQEKNIQNHNERGGEIFNGWRVALIGLISIAIFMGIIFSLAVFLNKGL
ncbi:hypothetical protein RB619_08710 [Flavobacterium sp. LHD-80]|uniref:hypothetical protein n=1 Tax=Flavobacterium sp. LHD-80 TaxID=3071411 RepID=UPI0027DF6D36|nr:hypothetical protein [Flavobacterium sp. LHD-80]MDQ6470719.1 hypothetical protein [Flavobacterium sp. LHD-80]